MPFGHKSMNRAAVLLIIVVITFDSLGFGNHLSASDEMPVRNLRLLYDVRMPLVGVYPLADFKGAIEFVFVDMNSKSWNVDVSIDGTITTGRETRRIQLSQSVAYPRRTDTMLLLDSRTDPTTEKAINVSGVRLNVGGGQVYFEGIFSFEGNSSVTTGAGRFDTYELKKEMRVVSGPVSKFWVTIYLHYEKTSGIMVYADMIARSGEYAYYYFMKLKETNAQIGDTSNCLVATAFHGSKLMDVVQVLRGFRDDVAIKTRSGLTFLNAFYLWYYSFSPAVADFQRKNELVRATMRILLLPILVGLTAARFLYPLLPFSPEFNMLTIGLVASTLIGSVYLGFMVAATRVCHKATFILTRVRKKYSSRNKL
jgi:hypothetical protein